MHRIQSNFRLAHTVAACVLGLASLGSARADVVTLGTLANPADYLADCTFWCVQRFQQVYLASAFGVSGPIQIDSVSFFAHPANGSNWNGTSSWRMTLSTTSQAVGGLSSTFNANVGGDATVFATATFSGTPSFGDLITFAGDFDYDAADGNLLVDIERVAGNAQGVGLQGVLNNGGVFDRAYAFNSSVQAEGFNQNYGNRTQFGFTTGSVVPEPGSLALVGVALVLAPLASRRRRSAA